MPTTIDQLEALEINGTRQWVLYRGEEEANPVVLFVHGGPGYPLMWFSRAFDDFLLKDFIVVHWDQRNAGKSYCPSMPTLTFTLSQIAGDGLKVTEHLKDRFRTTKILLVGHSWGTLVASRMAAERPDHFRAYVSVSTVPDSRRADELKYDACKTLAHERNDRQAIEDLARLGPPPYLSFKQFEFFGQIIHKLMGLSVASRRFSEDDLAQAILKSKEYSDAEFEAAFEALRMSVDHLAGFLNSYVLSAAVPRLDVPVWFVQGKHDMNTPTVLTEEYFQLLDAPHGKHWALFDESAHFPMYEEPQKFLQVLKSTLTR
jgi:pimeloyl-ACP methyl ester carboxylesterase